MNQRFVIFKLLNLFGSALILASCTPSSRSRSGKECMPVAQVGEVCLQGKVSRTPCEEAAPEKPTCSALRVGGHLSLNEAVEFALRENVETKISKVQSRAAWTGIDREMGVFDPLIGADQSTGVNEFRNGNFAVDVAKQFQTGTQLRVEAGSSYSQYDNINDVLSTSQSTDLGVRLRQPLLRGAGTQFNRSGMDQALLVADAADIQTRAQILVMLRDVETAYWAASTYQELVGYREQSVARTRELLADVKTRKELGNATTIDVLEAEASVADASAELVRAKKTYQDEVDNLRILLGGELCDTMKDWMLSGTTRAFDQIPAPSTKTVFERAIDEAPQIALVVNQIDQKKIAAYRAEREKLPQVDLELDTLRRGDAVDEFDSPWETLGVVRVSVPWGNRERKALYDQALAELEASHLTKTEAERRLKQQIYEVTRRIATGREELQVANQALSVNRAKWIEQQKRSEEGLVSTRRLREAEQELRASEVNESEARLRLISAWSLLSQLDGSIAKRLGVCVKA